MKPRPQSAPRTNRRTEQINESVLNFLATNCEESSSWSLLMTDLYAGYCQWFSTRRVEDYEPGVTLMRPVSQPAFAQRVVDLGYKLDRRPNHHNEPRIWVIGLRLAYPRFFPKPEPKPEPKQEVATTQRKAVVVPPAVEPTPTHVEINGTLYNTELVSTVKGIVRPFEKGGKTITHVVTFKNGEIRHQWIDNETFRYLCVVMGGRAS